jgi:hypothetical protein
MVWKLLVMVGGGKPQWTVLQHNGPMFPEEYIDIIYLLLLIIIW